MKDLSINSKSGRFDLRASCIIKDMRGQKVLLNRLLDDKENKTYIAVGGRIKLYESSFDAIQRELNEELKLNVNNLTLLSINELLLEDRKRHIVEFFYGTRVKDIESLADNNLYKVFDINSLIDVNLLPKSLYDIILSYTF